MKYTPKHKDTVMRALYAGLVFLSIIFTNVGSGYVKTILASLGIVMLSLGLYLFIRFELTSYEYIVMEQESRFDFYVNKLVGKRGGYVCYYPLTDAVALEKYRKGTRKELEKRYKKIYIYNYTHNTFHTEKQIIVFKNEGYYDAVIIELGENEDYLNKIINLTNEPNDKE